MKRFWRKITLNRIHWEILITLIGLGSLLFAIAKSRAIDFEQYQQYRSKISQLQEKESDLIQIILSSRYALYVSYDPLVHNLNEQKQLQQQLENIPGFLNSREKQEIYDLLQERETLLTQKQSLSEWFKSQNALLKNSLRYLPLLASQLEEKVSSRLEENETAIDDPLTPLRILFNDLLRNVLLYNITNNVEIVPRIEQQIEQLSQLQEREQIDERVFPVQLAISHANIILTQKPQVEELTTQLLTLSPQQTEDLANLYRISYQNARQTVNIYRFIRSGLFLMLLIWIDYLILKRLNGFRKNNAQVQQSSTNTAKPQTDKNPEFSEEKKERKTLVESENLAQSVDKKKLNNIEGEEVTQNTNLYPVERVTQIKKNHQYINDFNREVEQTKTIDVVKANQKSSEDIESEPISESNVAVDAMTDRQDIAVLENHEIKQLETRKNVQSSASIQPDKTENNQPMATLPVHLSNSKNPPLWLYQMNRYGSSLMKVVQRHIHNKTCKQWLDRLTRSRKDLLVKLKQKSSKNKVK